MHDSPIDILFLIQNVVDFVIRKKNIQRLKRQVFDTLNTCFDTCITKSLIRPLVLETKDT